MKIKFKILYDEYTIEDYKPSDFDTLSRLRRGDATAENIHFYDEEQDELEIKISKEIEKRELQHKRDAEQYERWYRSERDEKIQLVEKVKNLTEAVAKLGGANAA